jgi:hypothetical protein
MMAGGITAPIGTLAMPRSPSVGGQLKAAERKDRLSWTGDAVSELTMRKEDDLRALVFDEEATASFQAQRSRDRSVPS